MFTNNLEPVISNKVATIGGKYFIINGIGTVRWSWNDADVQLHTKKLDNFLTFQTHQSTY